MKKKIVSGITATGDLTIGNYIGAIKNFVDLQDQYEMYIFVADLHALTIDIEPKVLRENINKIMALYIACGLDPKKVKLFVQSDILEHANLGHILLTRTTIGELSRMTQFKTKGKVQSNKTESIPTGILTYPTLMAADILLYNPDFVLVGNDQKQHIELTRNIAIRFNNKFGKTFIVPEPMIPKQGARIMSLTDPYSKMSKSSKVEKSMIKLLDDPQKAYKKIMSALTDSENKVLYDPKNKAGISNLMTIYACLDNKTVDEVGDECKNLNYGEFKKKVAMVVKAFLEEKQLAYKQAIKTINEVRIMNLEEIQKNARITLAKVKRKIGLS